MTKEPKLKAAMRIVPEWKDYDYEIKVFWDTIYGTNTRSQIEYDPPELSPEKKGEEIIFILRFSFYQFCSFCQACLW